MSPAIADAIATAARDANCGIDEFVERALHAAATGWQDTPSSNPVSSGSGTSLIAGVPAHDFAAETTVTYVEFGRAA